MPDTDSADTPGTPTFFEANYDRIRRYIVSMMRDPEEAEDLAQETFLRAYRQRDSLRDPGALKAWLYQIATHICLDRLRQRARRTPLEAEAELDDIASDSDTPPPQAVEQNEMSTCVQRYLADLPDNYRAVILLQDMHGLTGPEIAEILAVSLATVKIRLHRARRKLRAALEAACEFSHDERNVLVCESKD